MKKVLSNRFADWVVTLIKYGVKTYALQTLIMYSFVFAAYNFLDPTVLTVVEGEIVEVATPIREFADSIVHFIVNKDLGGLVWYIRYPGMELLKEYTFLTYTMAGIVMAMMMFGKYIKEGFKNFINYLLLSKVRKTIIMFLMMRLIRAYVRRRAAKNEVSSFDEISENRAYIFDRGLFTVLFSKWVCLKESMFEYNNLSDIIAAKEEAIKHLCEVYARRCA